jgi:hypothetical protein
MLLSVGFNAYTLEPYLQSPCFEALVIPLSAGLKAYALKL